MAGAQYNKLLWRRDLQRDCQALCWRGDRKVEKPSHDGGNPRGVDQRERSSTARIMLISTSTVHSPSALCAMLPSAFGSAQRTLPRRAFLSPSMLSSTALIATLSGTVSGSP